MLADLAAQQRELYSPSNLSKSSTDLHQGELSKPECKPDNEGPVHWNATDFTEFLGELGSHPVARGGFADVYKTTLGTSTVAIKVVRSFVASGITLEDLTRVGLTAYFEMKTDLLRSGQCESSISGQNWNIATSYRSRASALYTVQAYPLSFRLGKITGGYIVFLRSILRLIFLGW